MWYVHAQVPVRLLRAMMLNCLDLQGMLADVSIATGWMTIALMLTGRFVFQVCNNALLSWPVLTRA